MGFGLLLVGYATLLLFKTVPVELAGFFLIYLGLDKLQNHEASFRYAKYASIYMFAESVFSTLGWISTYLHMPMGFISEPWFETVETVMYHSGLLVFHLLLYRGIASISEVVGYAKGKNRVRFGTVMTAVFYVAVLCGMLIPNASVYFAKPLIVFQILWLLVNLFMLFGCYMMIVTDEMLEKEDKKYAEYLEKNPPRTPKTKNQRKKTKKGGTEQTKYKATKK